MPVVIAWCGYVGAWCLVAGPVFQAAIELEDEEFERESIAAAARTVGAPPRVSPWWWLLPPVAYVLQARRRRVYREAVFDALDDTDAERYVSYSNVAVGWLMVGMGAFFIGVKETWELHEVYDWPLWAFVALLLVAVVTCVGNTVLRLRRSHTMLTRAHHSD